MIFPPARFAAYPPSHQSINPSIPFDPMPQVHIIMPQLGESIAEARIIQFLVKPGDNVEADQDLIEVETDKATMTVASPCKGRIEKISAQLNEKLRRRRDAWPHRSHAGGGSAPRNGCRLHAKKFRRRGDVQV